MLVFDERLVAIKPLLRLLSNDIMIVEKVDFDDLTDAEKTSIERVEMEFARGETVRHEDIDWN